MQPADRYDGFTMLERLSPLARLRASLANSEVDPRSVVEEVLARANGSLSRNTYLWLDPAALRSRAKALSEIPDAARMPLWAVPISLKDCFDLAGTPTSCGSWFYARRGPVSEDSAMAASLCRAGALIAGKTHLHPLAYGITGENPEYGDCRQPRDPTLLTGGSSSGAAASVQEGSALAAVGTDTGGSIRVPAALCGLVGYRASHRLTHDWWPQAWQGAEHLAPSFDTPGLLLHDPRDAAPLASALFGVPSEAAPGPPADGPRIGCISWSFLADCHADVLTAFEAWKRELAAGGAQIVHLEAAKIELNKADAAEGEAIDWQGAPAIFAGIQAHEAARIHAGSFDHFEPAIRDRLRWGAALPPAELAVLRLRLAAFRAAMLRLLARFDFLMLPCAPISSLVAGADHSSVRQRILRYTAPFSLAGLPALSLPGEMIGAPRGTGIQLAGAPGADPGLLAYADAIGRRIASEP